MTFKNYPYSIYFSLYLEVIINYRQFVYFCFSKNFVVLLNFPVCVETITLHGRMQMCLESKQWALNASHALFLLCGALLNFVTRKKWNSMYQWKKNPSCFRFPNLISGDKNNNNNKFVFLFNQHRKKVKYLRLSWSKWHHILFKA